jgi:hypothetical protein
VINRTGKFYSEWSSHLGKLAGWGEMDKSQGLTLAFLRPDPCVLAFAGKFYSEWSSHLGKLAGWGEMGKSQGLTLAFQGLTLAFDGQESRPDPCV